MCIHYQGGTLDCNNIFIVTYGNWLSILTISEFCGLCFIPGCFLMSFMIDHIVMLCKPRGGRGDGGGGGGNEGHACYSFIAHFIQNNLQH